MWEGAHVFGHVPSQRSIFPLFKVWWNVRQGVFHQTCRALKALVGMGCWLWWVIYGWHHSLSCGGGVSPHCCMVGVSPLTPVVAKTMGGKVVDLSSAMGTLVWSAKRGAESESYCYTGGLVIQPEPPAGHRKIVIRRLSSRWRKVWPPARWQTRHSFVADSLLEVDVTSFGTVNSS